MSSRAENERNNKTGSVSSAGRNASKASRKQTMQDNDDVPPLRCLDLFSGIGGFARGLRFLCTTAAFCDMAPKSCAVLASNKELKGVPILPDVTKIDAKALRELQPDMLTAGFPCQDISSMLVTKDGEVRAGLDGPRSRLFFEIPRLVRESGGKLRHVFLENSPCIVGRDSERVIEELQKVGLNHLAYGVFAASDVGALHRRRRWFCLATSHPQELPLMTKEQLGKAIRHPWHKDIPRVLPRPSDPKERAALTFRNSLLGNSVVPQAVAYAYQSLATILREAPNTPSQLASTRSSGGQREPALPLSNSVVLVVTDPKRRKQQLMQKDPVPAGSEDAAEERKVFPRPKLAVMPQKSTRLNLDMRDSEGNQPDRKLTQWMTPRHHVATWHQSRQLNERAMWNLSNGIYYEVGTRQHCPQAKDNVNHMSDVCTINPRFVENLMGYPLDWTKTEIGSLPWPCSETHVQPKPRRAPPLRGTRNSPSKNSRNGQGNLSTKPISKRKKQSSVPKSNAKTNASTNGSTSARRQKTAK